MIEPSSVEVLEKGFFYKDEIAQAWLFGVSKQKRRWKNFMALYASCIAMSI